jgi:hypothetical protein
MAKDITLEDVVAWKSIAIEEEITHPCGTTGGKLHPHG